MAAICRVNFSLHRSVSVQVIELSLEECQAYVNATALQESMQVRISNALSISRVFLREARFQVSFLLQEQRLLSQKGVCAHL